MVTKILQLHKRSSYQYEFIQDKYGIKSSSGVYCIADGTTQSFKSEIWASMLTESFIWKPSFDPEVLLTELNKLAFSFQAEPITYSLNPAKAALERQKIAYGASSTFLGIQLDQNIMSFISVGDSNLFVLRGSVIFSSFPYSSVEQLDQNKEFLNSEEILKDKVALSFFKTNTFKVEEGDQIILATDALSRLILSDQTVLKQVVSINSFGELLAFCTKKWEDKTLEEDDISAVIILVTAKLSEQVIVPPNDFMFDKEPERKFIPFVKAAEVFNPMDCYQTVLTEIDRLKSDVKSLKKRITVQRKVIFIATIFCLTSVLISSCLYNEIKNIEASVSPVSKNSKPGSLKFKPVHDSKAWLKHALDKFFFNQVSVNQD